MSAWRCPRCDSPSPELHPAIQHEGEVHLCGHAYHKRVTPENTAERIAQTFPAREPERDMAAARRVLPKAHCRCDVPQASGPPIPCLDHEVIAQEIAAARSEERKRIVQRMEDWAACLGVSRLDEDLVGRVYLENFAATLRTDFEGNKA